MKGVDSDQHHQQTQADGLSTITYAILEAIRNQLRTII